MILTLQPWPPTAVTNPARQSVITTHFFFLLSPLTKIESEETYISADEVILVWWIKQPELAWASGGDGETTKCAFRGHVESRMLTTFTWPKPFALLRTGLGQNFPSRTSLSFVFQTFQYPLIIMFNVYYSPTFRSCLSLNSIKTT